ncbi:HD-GYP domain-containing protein [Anaerovorax sp. IOR16]|uniref:HD-GYP domain-containing protein n=1 Tax=Anaerovorax sp. IOR16 TaxID=2773458 RepID=UPI0019D11076|nr:HD domain-containing phosphohydrolase [Anaerovorax sp. IOR16]
MELNHYHYKRVKEIIPGDILLHPIYRGDGLLLINRYKALNVDLISKIRQHVSPSFFVLVVESQSNLEEFLSSREYEDIEYYKKLLLIVNQYNEISTIPMKMDSFIGEDMQVVAGQIIKKVIDDNDKNYFEKVLFQVPSFNAFEKNIESEMARSRAASIKNKLTLLIRQSKDLQSQFLRIKMYKDIFFIHSVNTASMSLMIGLCLELSEDELVDLAIAALFADIGYTKISKETFNEYLINKESNRDVLLEHNKLLLELAMKTEKLREEAILHGIIDRHENYDGSGFPCGKKGKEISLFGRIIHISQAYDELVGGYSGTILTPRNAIKKLWLDAGNQLDADILKLFIYRTIFYKVGQTSILEDGRQIKIIGFKDFINDPISPITHVE